MFLYIKCAKGRDIRGNGGRYLRAQVLREALKISSPLALVSREVPRFHGGSLWHSTPGNKYELSSRWTK